VFFRYIKGRLIGMNGDKFAGKWLRRVGTWGWDMGLGRGVGTSNKLR